MTELQYQLDPNSLQSRRSGWMRSVPCARVIVVAALLALPLSRPVSGQGTDPRADFLNALGRFSLALDGAFGDEGRALSSALDSMADALSRWDAFIATRERAMAAEIGSADRKLASRMHLALGGVYLDRGRAREALKELSAARTADPTRPEAPLLQGLVHLQVTRDTAAATAALQTAHELSPQDPARAYLLARQLVDGTQREAGLALLQRIQHVPGPTATPAGALFIRLNLVPETPGINPFFPPTLYAEGFAALQQGDLAKAIAQFRESARRDPLMSLATAKAGDPLIRAIVAFKDGLVDEARTQLKSAITQSPKQGEAHRILGMVHLADGDRQSGIASLRTAALLNAGDERTRLALGNALLEAEQLDDAEQALVDALRALPASGGAHYLLGLTYQRQGKRQDALRALEAALGLNPLLGVNTIHRMIGSLQQDQQDLDGAGKSLAARIDLVPNDHQAHRDLGRVHVLQGDEVRARAEFEVALLLNPADVESYTSLGQLHLREGRYQDAIEVSRRALEVDASHREARYVYATALLRTGNTAEGTAEMQVFQRLQAEDSAGRARAFELGRLRREAAVSRASSDHANAVVLLRRAVVLEPTSATSHLDLGVALLESGQAAEAIERLTTAAALNAPFDVHRHLAKAYAAQGQSAESQKEQATYERLRRESISRAGRAR
jgi:tetratricopeptide (TPR) repeat protein